MLGRFCRLLLSAWAVVGGLHAAELNPARWEKEIAAFEAMDRTNSTPKGAVLFVGSSSIRLWKNIAADFPDLTIISRGFGGSHIPDTTHFADRIILPYEPSKIVLYAGDNDIARGHSPQRVLRDFRDLVEKVHTKLPKTKIYFLAIKPSPSRWHLSPQSAEANQMIKGYCRFRPKLEYIDVWTPLMKDGQPDPSLFEKDRLHLNGDGYARWKTVIQRALKD
ncbi:MAG: SGNH/GDSL hydrolase family protein [Limisphaerales bacterium]